MGDAGHSSWKPTYRAGKKSFTAHEIECRECPVGFITPESFELVRICTAARCAADAGASLYGPDLSKWPAREYDAFVIVQQEHARIEEAYSNAT